MSVPQCDVFGYLSIESELVILITPVDHLPKALQVGFGGLLGGLGEETGERSQEQESIQVKKCRCAASCGKWWQSS